MKKLLIFIMCGFMLVSLSACVERAVKVGTGTVFAVSELFSSAEPLYVDEFCKERIRDLNATKKKYDGKRYVFEGPITEIQQQKEYTVMCIEDVDGKAWAKVYNYNGQVKVGQTAQIEGLISPANFDKSRLNNCQLLLDDALILEEKETE